MGVSMEQVNSGALELNKLLAQGMNLWNTVSGKQTATATPAIAQTTTTPAVNPGSQTATTQAAGGIQISTGMLIIGGLVVAALLWRRGT